MYLYGSNLPVSRCRRRRSSYVNYIHDTHTRKHTQRYTESATSFSLIMLISIGLKWKSACLLWDDASRSSFYSRLSKRKNRLVLCFYVFITETIAALTPATVTAAAAAAKLFVFRWCIHCIAELTTHAIPNESRVLLFLWNLFMLLCGVISVQCHYISPGSQPAILTLRASAIWIGSSTRVSTSVSVHHLRQRSVWLSLNVKMLCSPRHQALSTRTAKDFSAQSVHEIGGNWLGTTVCRFTPHEETCSLRSLSHIIRF